VKNENWRKNAPTNAIWWTINDGNPPPPLFKSSELERDQMDDNDDDFNDDTNEGNFNIFFSVFSKYLE